MLTPFERSAKNFHLINGHGQRTTEAADTHTHTHVRPIMTTVRDVCQGANDWRPLAEQTKRRRISPCCQRPAAVADPGTGHSHRSAFVACGKNGQRFRSDNIDEDA